MQVLFEGLGALEAELWEMASGEGQTWMSEAGDWLQSRVKSSLEEKPPGEWVYSLLRIGIAANQLARSVANIHTTKIAWCSRVTWPMLFLQPPTKQKEDSAPPLDLPNTVEAIRQLLLEQEKTNAELKAKLEAINRLL